MIHTSSGKTKAARDFPIPSAIENTVPNDYLDNKTPVLVIMGVSGCGKSTMNQHLSSKLGWDVAEADDLHPQANIDKMANGIPLNDEDRWPWLDKIHDWIENHMDHKTPGTVTCSALRRAYREKIWMPGVVFVYLSGDYDSIMERLSHRQGHFMKPQMLKSQFDTLEPPSKDEIHMTIDVGLHMTPEVEAEEVIDTLNLQCAVEAHSEQVIAERARQEARKSEQG